MAILTRFKSNEKLQAEALDILWARAGWNRLDNRARIGVHSFATLAAIRPVSSHSPRLTAAQSAVSPH
jgi:hypothetical protein